LLLVFAPLDELDHAALEVADIRQADGQTVCRGVAAVWQLEHPADALLEFVESQPGASRQEAQAWSPPTRDECRSADSMMRLTDPELRALVESCTYVVEQNLPLPSPDKDYLNP
jgi:hypothetical protein